MSTAVQTVMLAGQRFVILPEAEYRQLRGENDEPALPEPDAKGNFPAVETMHVILAQKIIQRRRLAGLTQAELARRAGIRQETLNRLEEGKHSPSMVTVDKVDRALSEVEKGQPENATTVPMPRKRHSKPPRR